MAIDDDFKEICNTIFDEDTSYRRHQEKGTNMSKEINLSETQKQLLLKLYECILKRK